MGSSLIRLTIASGLLFSSGAVLAKKEKGPVDEVVDKWKAAHERKKESPPGPVVIPADDCQKFAKELIKAGDKEKAREADAIFNAGAVYEECGMEKDAEAMYKQALSKNPKLAPAMNNLGVMMQRQGRVQEAMLQYENAIKADPKSPLAVSAYNNRGALLYERARQANNKAGFDEAIGQLRRALALDAESMPAYQILASIYYTTAEADRSKLRLAQLVCDEAKKINPDYAPIYNTLGLIKLRSKDVTGALTEFRKAATLDPGLSEAQLNIGAISLSARSYKQAEEAFQAVLKKVPNHFDATVGMGVALRGQRKADEAEQWYAKALQAQVDPKVEPRLEAKKCGVLYNLGLLYQDYKNGSTDDMNKGKDYYNKFMACEKTDQEHIADSKRRIKDIDDTFKALEEQKKLEAELKQQMAEMEKQQKLMEEQMKQQGGGAAPPAGGAAPPPAGGGTAPPPAAPAPSK
jgi:tetratricopeptide (TPR) repeat protein